MKQAVRLVTVLVAVVLASLSGPAGTAHAAAFPAYDHVFLVIEENHNASQIIGNPAAPIINALAQDYGSATRYTGVADPSEPNYVAMLGGSTFGIASDDPYFFPGQTVAQPNLMSQLEAAGKTWKGYFQGLPYAGYRGFCFPAKCNGIPDSDTQYVAKHNGAVNFANLQTPAEFARQVPFQQLGADLASGQVPNFSYIVPDECTDMHGAPPWCLDSDKAGSVSDTFLVATGDGFVGGLVNQITSSAVWKSGNDAIVFTFDEGNVARSQVATVVVTNHGPRGASDNHSYDHFNLLASLELGFGLGCLQSACGANPMTPLFQVTGSTSVPALPAPFTPPPNGSDSVSPPGAALKGAAATLTCAGGWNQVPSPSIGNLDNNLVSVSAASPGDAWAVGSLLQSNNPAVLQTMAEHWDGTSWTETPLPDVGLNENSLFGVSELSGGRAWAVGYFVNATYHQRTLVEHFDGTSWSVVPSANPGTLRDVLYGVAAVTDSNVWAVGGQQDSTGVFHTLVEHWDGTSWSAVSVPDPNGGGNVLYAVAAVSAGDVSAAGQEGTAFPSQALVEHFDGKNWSLENSPADPTETLTTLGLTASGSALTIVGDRENGTVPYTTEVAAGAPSSLALVTSANVGAGENDLFGATTAGDGTTWAAGWLIDPATGNHRTLVEHGVGGVWSVTTTPDPGTGDTGFASIAAVPGGGLWAVGVTSGSGNFSTLISFHC
jgi:hypothetical protein